MLVAVALSCLIVDDNPEFLDTARHLLDREGINVIGVAANSAEAIEQVADLRPDVVLVDVHLAEENGVLLARRIAALGPRVILISTYPESDLGETLPTGVTIEFVSKVELSASAIRATLGLTPDDEITD